VAYLGECIRVVALKITKPEGLVGNILEDAQGNTHWQKCPYSYGDV